MVFLALIAMNILNTQPIQTSQNSLAEDNMFHTRWSDNLEISMQKRIPKTHTLVHPHKKQVNCTKDNQISFFFLSKI